MLAFLSHQQSFHPEKGTVHRQYNLNCHDIHTHNEFILTATVCEAYKVASVHTNVSRSSVALQRCRQHSSWWQSFSV